MGQTQLLLIILGVIIVGVAIYVGVTAFTANAEESTRSAIIQDLQNFAAQAIAHYKKVEGLGGGGGKSFKDITIRQLFPNVENANARYFVANAADEECVIVGMGKVVSSNGDSVCVRVRVTPNRNYVEILN